MNKILITGSSRGIGKSIKELLEKNGYDCLTPSRYELDISLPKSIKEYCKDIEVSGLINCAGINILGDIKSLNFEDTTNMLNSNLVTPLFLIKEVSVAMKKNKYGKIINISSIWGLRSKEYRTLYSMTKFGLNGMTKALARELGEYNILVNSIAPGYVNTEMTQQNIPLKQQEEIKETIPLRRFAESNEIAELVLFLISEKNSYMTGEVITIDGGFLA